MRDAYDAGMKVYEVGGAVRDALLGLPVVRARLGRRRRIGGASSKLWDIGASARTSPCSCTRRPARNTRSRAPSARRAAATRRLRSTPRRRSRSRTTLQRRDLTINAIARAEDGEIVDPWAGRADLKARVLRHVSPALQRRPAARAARRTLRGALRAASVHDRRRNARAS